MSQLKKVINSPFVRPVDRDEFAGKETGELDYIDRKIYLEFVETGRDEKTGKAIGSIEPVVRESKTNIEKLINSHVNEVGVKNLIALYARTGDSSLFNQRKSINSMTGGYVDLTAVPSESAEEIYAKIPDELKGDKSMEAFLKSLTKDQFMAFVESLKASVEKSSKKEEEVKNNE